MERTININAYSNKVKFYQKAIFLIMLFAPFTSLRIFRIGITESLSMLLFLFVFFLGYKIEIRNNKTFIFTKFWIMFFLTSGIGVFSNYIIFQNISGTINGLMFDTLSYLMVFLVCISLEMIIYNSKFLNIDYILNTTFFYSSLVLMYLFVISRFVGNIFIFSLLDQAHNFRPIAENIHHVAMFIGPLPFLGMYFLKYKTNKSSILINYILIISNIIIIFNVGSDKAILGFLLGCATLIVFRILEKIKRNSRLLLCLFMIIIIYTIVALNYELIINIVTSLFAESDGEGAREIFYKTSLNHSTNSPIFGFGPGQHLPGIDGGFDDTHSTFLTVLLQAGIMGIIIFIILLMKILNIFKANIYILASFASIFIYIAGGDILRRMPIWIYLVLFYYKILYDNKTSISKKITFN